MSFNGSGAYTPPGASFPAVASTLIESAKYNAVINDIATALTTCIAKDGQTTVTANIPFAGNKLTGVGAATARTDAATLATAQDGTGVYVGTVGGTANAITLTPSPAITAYVAGQRFYFMPASNNTAATTVAISGLTAKNVFAGGAACVSGEIIASVICAITYDGTQFNLNTSPFQDDRPLIVGSSDRTKKVRFEVDGLTTGTTRVLTVQDSSDTLVGRATTDTLTNKTLTSPTVNTPTVTSPTITGTIAGSATVGGTITVPFARFGVLPARETISTSPTTSSWTTVNNTTLGNAAATVAIIGIRVGVVANSAFQGINTVFLRKTGSGLGASANATEVAEAQSNIGDSSAQTTDVNFVIAFVELDGSADFDYFVSQSGGASYITELYLIGYFK